MPGAGPDRPELHPLNAEPFEATLYHGSGARFGEFDRCYLGKGTGGPDTVGFYLSDDRGCARYFAAQCRTGAFYIYTVAVSLMLPYRCFLAGLNNERAAAVHRDAMAALYDGVIITNGPKATLFVMVFWPLCLRILNIEEVAG